jgi:hypothetical protein
VVIVAVWSYRMTDVWPQSPRSYQCPYRRYEMSHCLGASKVYSTMRSQHFIVLSGGVRDHLSGVRGWGHLSGKERHHSPRERSRDLSWWDAEAGGEPSLWGERALLLVWEGTTYFLREKRRHTPFRVGGGDKREALFDGEARTESNFPGCASQVRIYRTST